MSQSSQFSQFSSLSEDAPFPQSQPMLSMFPTGDVKQRSLQVVHTPKNQQQHHLVSPHPTVSPYNSSSVKMPKQSFFSQNRTQNQQLQRPCPTPDSILRQSDQQHQSQRAILTPANISGVESSQVTEGDTSTSAMKSSKPTASSKKRPWMNACMDVINPYRRNRLEPRPRQSLNRTRDFHSGRNKSVSAVQSVTRPGSDVTSVLSERPKRRSKLDKRNSHDDSSVRTGCSKNNHTSGAMQEAKIKNMGVDDGKHVTPRYFSQTMSQDDESCSVERNGVDSESVIPETAPDEYNNYNSTSHPSNDSRCSGTCNLRKTCPHGTNANKRDESHSDHSQDILGHHRKPLPSSADDNGCNGDSHQGVIKNDVAIQTSDKESELEKLLISKQKELEVKIKEQEKYCEEQKNQVLDLSSQIKKMEEDMKSNCDKASKFNEIVDKAAAKMSKQEEELSARSAERLKQEEKKYESISSETLLLSSKMNKLDEDIKFNFDKVSKFNEMVETALDKIASKEEEVRARSIEIFRKEEERCKSAASKSHETLLLSASKLPEEVRQSVLPMIKSTVGDVLKEAIGEAKLQLTEYMKESFLEAKRIECSSALPQFQDVDAYDAILIEGRIADDKKQGSKNTLADPVVNPLPCNAVVDKKLPCNESNDTATPTERPTINPDMADDNAMLNVLASGCKKKNPENEISDHAYSASSSNQKVKKCGIPDNIMILEIGSRDDPRMSPIGDTDTRLEKRSRDCKSKGFKKDHALHSKSTKRGKRKRETSKIEKPKRSSNSASRSNIQTIKAHPRTVEESKKGKKAEKNVVPEKKPSHKKINMNSVKVSTDAKETPSENAFQAPIESFYAPIKKAENCNDRQHKMKKNKNDSEVENINKVTEEKVPKLKTKEKRKRDTIKTEVSMPPRRRSKRLKQNQLNKMAEHQVTRCVKSKTVNTTVIPDANDSDARSQDKKMQGSSKKRDAPKDAPFDENVKVNKMSEARDDVIEESRQQNRNALSKSETTKKTTFFLSAAQKQSNSKKKVQPKSTRGKVGISRTISKIYDAISETMSFASFSVKRRRSRTFDFSSSPTIDVPVEQIGTCASKDHSNSSGGKQKTLTSRGQYRKRRRIIIPGKSAVP